MQYIAKHSRSYASLAEYEFRKALYTNTNAVIQEHNSSQTSYRLALNKFSDRSESEMAQMYGEVKDFTKSEQEPTILPVPESYAPINWVTNGCVNEIQD